MSILRDTIKTGTVKELPFRVRSEVDNEGRTPLLWQVLIGLTRLSQVICHM